MDGKRIKWAKSGEKAMMAGMLKREEDNQQQVKLMGNGSKNKENTRDHQRNIFVL